MTDPVSIQLTRAEAMTLLPILRSQRGTNEIFKANVLPESDLFEQMQHIDDVIVGIMQQIKREAGV